MRKLIWLPLVVVPLLCSCGERAKGKQDKVLATVNGDSVTEAMFDKEAEGLPPYVRPILETPNGRMQFLESLITRDLLMREALRRGVDRRADVRGRIELARRSIVLETLLRDIAEKAPGLSDDALRRHYESNKDSFRVGERVKVTHLLAKERTVAEEMARRAKGGEPFDEVTKAASAAGGTGADLGFIERGSFVKEFEDAAFAAAPGSIVGPVRTPYGYHVIKVGEKKPAGLQPFEEVRPKIAAELREGAQREAFEAIVADLKKRSKIEYLVKPDGGTGDGASPAAPESPVPPAPPRGVR